MDRSYRSQRDGWASAQFEIERKNIVVAYLLLFFAGYLGAHRFYLGRPLAGALILVSTLFVGVLTLFSLGILAILFLPISLWLLIEIFLLPSIVRNHDTRLADNLFG